MIRMYRVYIDRPWTVTIWVWIFVVILIFDAALFNQSAWRDRTTWPTLPVQPPVLRRDSDQESSAGSSETLFQ